MVERIRRDVSAFSAVASAETVAELSQVVDQTVDAFVAALTGRLADTEGLSRTYRHLGAQAARGGHGLDAMRAAGQIARQEGWHELQVISSEYVLGPDAVTRLIDALLSYEGFLMDQATIGFRSALATRGVQSDHARLASAVLTGRPVREVLRLSERAHWALPAWWTIASVRVPRDESLDLPDAGDALLCRNRGEVIVLGPPGAVAAASRRLVAAHRRLVVISWPVHLREVRDAYRWVSQAHSLVGQGVIPVPQDGVLRCGELIDVMLLNADPALRRYASSKLLARLSTEPPSQQEALVETMLLSWRSQLKAPAIAERLGVHEQTVRHRLRRMHELFGEELKCESKALALLSALDLFHATMTRGASRGPEVVTLMTKAATDPEQPGRNPLSEPGSDATVGPC